MSCTPSITGHLRHSRGSRASSNTSQLGIIAINRDPPNNPLGCSLKSVLFYYLCVNGGLFSIAFPFFVEK